MIDYYKNRMNLVLPGAGFLGCYYFGAISILMQVWPDHPHEKISGASCGGIIAGLLSSGVTLEEVVLGYHKIYERIKYMNLTETVRRLMEEMLPIRAHKIVSGNIGISLTRWKDYTSTVATQFDSRSDLIDAIVAGCFIPVWSGKLMPPTYLGTKCFDGAWTDNVPKLDIDECDRAKGVYQVIASPFYGDVDVCPCDEDQGFGLRSSFGMKVYFNFNNMCRAVNAIFKRKSDFVDKIITQGHDDMKRYLLKDNLLKCRRCHELDSGEGSLNNNITSISEKNRACLRCLLLKEKVSNLKVPTEILSENQLQLLKKDRYIINSIYNSPHRK